MEDSVIYDDVVGESQSNTCRAFRAYEENGGPSVSKRLILKGDSCVMDEDEEEDTDSGIQQSRRGHYKCGSRRLREGIANEQMSETEGERQLKRLLDKQLDKTVTLEDQFVRHRTFQSAVTYVPLTTELSGQMTMGQFKVEESRKERVDDLRQLGLSEDEIRITLDREEMSETLNAGLGKEPGVLRDQLSLIENKITARTEEISKLHSFRDAKVVSRHEMELEKSLKPNSQHAQLLMQLMTMERKKSDRSIDDVPIDILKDMERELSERVDRIHENKARKTRKQSVETDSAADESNGFGPWQVVDIPLREETSKHEARKECATKAVNSEDPVIRDYVVPVSKEEIDKNRLGLEEIRRLLRFSDYVPGDPTNVLYIKNLVQGIKETDLVALFGRFQKNEELQFRLMKGKMKGQAFVTFPNTDLATKAMKFVNGFIWKGKPIIIQYGRIRESMNRVIL